MYILLKVIKVISPKITYIGISCGTLTFCVVKIVEKLLAHYCYAELVVSNYFADLSLDVSPFIICVLEKCLKVIRSKSRSCSLPKKSIVLLYTCNTVKYLLQTQVCT